MSFTVSPGVSVREVDLTTVVRAASSTDGAMAGKFGWGPVNQVTLVSSEDELQQVFGKPNDETAVDFFTAGSFLAYTDKLRIVRIGNSTDPSNSTDSGTPVTFINDEGFDAAAGNISDATWIGKYVGEIGNSLSVAVATSADEYEFELSGTWTFVRGTRTATYVPGAGEVLGDFFNTGDQLSVDGTKYNIESVTDTVVTLTRIYNGSITPTTITRLWRFAGLFGNAPGTDEVHVVVIDADGEFTAEKGTLLESYEGLSTVAGTKYPDGSTAYYKSAINRRSRYIRVGDVDVSTVNTGDKIDLIQLSGGVSGNAGYGDDEYLDGYDFFRNSETVDVSLILSSGSNAIRSSYLIENIAEERRDAIVFISPEFADVVNNSGNEVADIIEFRNSLPSSSYAVLDSGWKYTYDKYNDAFRWVPLNGDIAGLAARTDRQRDAWYSPAGFNRGGIKNIVKLAFSPDSPQRDDLYTNSVNPVTDFPGQGTVLFGDKTLLAKPSAFDRINVRRLFIILEKAIANASKFTLFEFNDEFTRSQFVSLVEPFLREVKGRRGITDFRVVADETVNTPQVIDSNQFIGQIYIKPTRSINFIRLDFVAVRSGVSFEEIAGQF